MDMLLQRASENDYERERTDGGKAKEGGAESI